MLLTIGVDSVESSSSTKAMKNSIDKGVAGRSMMATDAGTLKRCGSPEAGSLECAWCRATVVVCQRSEVEAQAGR